MSAQAADFDPFGPATAAPPDPIAGLTEQFVADARTHKVNLGVGVYLDAQGRVPVLRAVRAAQEALVAAGKPSDYLPIDGMRGYNTAVQRLIFGNDAPCVAEGRAVTIQVPGGTGALRVGADLLRRMAPESKVLVSDPTWNNHHGVFKTAGLLVATYPYFDSLTRGVDESGMFAALDAAPRGSIVVLHACCHNPTGADLSPAQWDRVIERLKRRSLIAFLDMAYQGFADGLDADAAPARQLARAGVPLLVASSFSKNLSLYGERVGALTVIAAHEEQAGRVRSELKQLVRANYSNPPLHGARIAQAVLDDEQLASDWRAELTEMRERVAGMRVALAEAMRARGHGDRFDFITRQRGLFSFLGITAAQARRLREEFAVYALDSGRICIAGLHPDNLARVADSLSAVIG